MPAVMNSATISDEESDGDFHSAEENLEPTDSDGVEEEEENDDSSDNDVDMSDKDDLEESKSGSSDESDDASESEETDEVKHMASNSSNEKKINENSSESESDNQSDEENNSESDTDNSNNEEKLDDENKYSNSGWADAMDKILKTNKPKKKKALVLSRAKKIVDVKKVKKEEPGFEVVDDGKEKKPLADQTVKIEDDDGEPKVKKRREELPNMRVKPNILEKGREKVLSKIATRGVVQLFNAVRKQQKDIECKIENVGPLERKKEKVIKSLDKHKFLDMLMGQSKSEVVNKKLAKKETKEEIKEEESKWSVFRDDFVSGAKMKDWDKKDKDTSDNEKISDMSDSD